MTIKNTADVVTVTKYVIYPSIITVVAMAANSYLSTPQMNRIDTKITRMDAELRNVAVRLGAVERNVKSLQTRHDLSKQ